MAIGIERCVTIRFADVHVRIVAGTTDVVWGALCRFDIDPEAIQVWPLSQTVRNAPLRRYHTPAEASILFCRSKLTRRNRLAQLLWACPSRGLLAFCSDRNIGGRNAGERNTGGIRRFDAHCFTVSLTPASHVRESAIEEFGAKPRSGRLQAKPAKPIVHHNTRARSKQAAVLALLSRPPRPLRP
jgi:hypothetical protein